MEPCNMAFKDRLFRKFAILAVVLLTFHGSTIASSIPGELEKPAPPSSGILNPTRREGMIWRNPFAKGCETGHRPQRSIQKLLPMPPCPAPASESDTADLASLHIPAVKIESSCSLRLSVAEAVPKNRVLYPGFSLPTFIQGVGTWADHSERLTPTFGLAKCRSVPVLSATQTYAGFTGVSNRPDPAGIGSQGVFLSAGRQAPGFPLVETPPADHAGSQAQPLTTPRLFAGDVLHDQERI